MRHLSLTRIGVALMMTAVVGCTMTKRGQADARVQNWIDQIRNESPKTHRSAPEWAAVLVSFADEPQGFVGPLVQALEDDDAFVRQSAAYAIGNIGASADAAVTALVGRLGDDDAKVRRAAMWALGRIGPGAEPAADALVDALKDEGARLGMNPHTALVALAQIGPRSGRGAKALADAVTALRAGLKDKDPAARRAAMEALGIIGPPAGPAEEALVEALKDEAVRQGVAPHSALVALARIGPRLESTVRPLLAYVRPGKGSAPWADAYQAIVALGKLGPKAKEALPILRAVLHAVQHEEIQNPRKGSSDVRIAAGRAIHLISED